MSPKSATLPGLSLEAADLMLSELLRLRSDVKAMTGVREVPALDPLFINAMTIRENMLAITRRAPTVSSAGTGSGTGSASPPGKEAGDETMKKYSHTALKDAVNAVPKDVREKSYAMLPSEHQAAARRIEELAGHRNRGNLQIDVHPQLVAMAKHELRLAGTGPTVTALARHALRELPTDERADGNVCWLIAPSHWLTEDYLIPLLTKRYAERRDRVLDEARKIQRAEQIGAEHAATINEAGDTLTFHLRKRRPLSRAEAEKLARAPARMTYRSQVDAFIRTFEQVLQKKADNKE
ncbi:hypothetical protein ROTAS13_03498 [Roseomonas sp. TAS13]|uniref:hypothetical protein n=1 Tax=Roseomonas TaxID=125216 RepID=UPI00096080EE|nr:hypothetical protein [Roseomonas sp. TAS13]GAV35819.1 hypothetical protein ROTAS13_03498 [Roseomonas sp. TAS13]